jgi:excisionase family DNA binding protein
VSQLPSSMLPGRLAGSVFAIPKVAAEVASIVREAMRQRAREGWQFSPAAWDWLRGLEVSAMGVREELAAGTELARARPPTLSSLILTDDADEITVKEFAEALDISESAVRQRITNGSLPARRDERGHYRIRRENLEVSES